MIIYPNHIYISIDRVVFEYTSTHVTLTIQINLLFIVYRDCNLFLVFEYILDDLFICKQEINS